MTIAKETSKPQNCDKTWHRFERMWPKLGHSPSSEIDAILLAVTGHVTLNEPMASPNFSLILVYLNEGTLS